ncbi:IS110 family transposase [Paenibacillus wynnii]|uniref:IS110 family transposase n=1 Tax=Paenibacillus wynnii TaxID=268407 RepID=UPI002793FC7E|nr:transposase [Paenibacillus wynnii]MDQ0191998.1 hypothetical protein [Paenibacillus wynnii]
MKNTIKYVGLDVSKEKIAVAIADEGREPDRRDAERLAQLHRAGELTAIHVPTRETEALRDLIRSREDAKEELHRARQRLIHFLLRHQIRQPEGMKKRWTKVYRQWLAQLTFEQAAEQLVFTESLQQLREVEERIKRLEAGMREQAKVCNSCARDSSVARSAGDCATDRYDISGGD